MLIVHRENRHIWNSYEVLCIWEAYAYHMQFIWKINSYDIHMNYFSYVNHISIKNDVEMRKWEKLSIKTIWWPLGDCSIFKKWCHLDLTKTKILITRSLIELYGGLLINVLKDGFAPKKIVTLWLFLALRCQFDHKYSP